MIALLTGIKTILINKNVGVDPDTHPNTDWSIFIGKQPTTPSRAVTVRRTPGLDANPKYLLDYPAIQIMVRGMANKYLETANKAQLIKDVLLGYPSNTINNVRWVLVNLIGDINDIGTDDNNNPLMSLNFQFIIEPPTNSDTNRIAL